MFESFPIIASGLLTGFVIGFLLQKGGVTKYEVIVRQILLRDFTVLKTMLTAIVVGGIGVFFLEGQGLARLSIMSALLVADIGGGLVPGVGTVLLALCPGTAFAALGERNSRAFAGKLGMLCGAFFRAEAYGGISGCAKWIDPGTMTLPQVLHVSPRIVLSGLAIRAVSLFIIRERMERKAG